MSRRTKLAATITSSAVLAAGAGYLTSVALSQTGDQPVTGTVTIQAGHRRARPTGATWTSWASRRGRVQHRASRSPRSCSCSPVKARPPLSSASRTPDLLPIN